MNYLPDVAISPAVQKIFDFEGGEDVALDFFTHLFKRIIEMAIEIAKITKRIHFQTLKINDISFSHLRIC